MYLSECVNRINADLENTQKERAQQLLKRDKFLRDATGLDDARIFITRYFPISSCMLGNKYTLRLYRNRICICKSDSMRDDACVAYFEVLRKKVSGYLIATGVKFVPQQDNIDLDKFTVDGYLRYLSVLDQVGELSKQLKEKGIDKEKFDLVKFAVLTYRDTPHILDIIYDGLK